VKFDTGDSFMKMCWKPSD